MLLEAAVIFNSTLVCCCFVYNIRNHLILQITLSNNCLITHDIVRCNHNIIFN